MELPSSPGTTECKVYNAALAPYALGAMELLAAMLAVTGIFGMAAYSVSKRLREHGIRVARKIHVMRAAVGQLMFLFCVRSAIGLLIALFANRFLAKIV